MWWKYFIYFSHSIWNNEEFSAVFCCRWSKNKTINDLLCRKYAKRSISEQQWVEKKTWTNFMPIKFDSKVCMHLSIIDESLSKWEKTPSDYKTLAYNIRYTFKILRSTEKMNENQNISSENQVNYGKIHLQLNRKSVNCWTNHTIFNTWLQINDHTSNNT